MSPFWALIEEYEFTIFHILFCIVFMLPLEKRPRFPLRLLIGVAVELSVPILFYSFIRMNSNIAAGLFLMAFFLGAIIYEICCPLSLWDCIYGSTCAYATQHMAYCIASIMDVVHPLTGDAVQIRTTLVYIAALILCYLVFARSMSIDGRFRMSARGAILALVIVDVLAIRCSMYAEVAYQADNAANAQLFMICRLYAALSCIFVLYIQTGIHKQMVVQRELQTNQLLWERHKAQYELTRENADLINRKCHDLKHQVAALRMVEDRSQRNRYLDDLERSVMIYDSNVKTGNQLLDTLLTEKSLLCEQRGITWSCVADGERLGFIDPVDLYALFGNALDNAIESSLRLTDPERRVVSLTVSVRGDLVVIQVENCYDGELNLSQGLPMTSKHDTQNHGYGMRSIRAIAEKYGGSLSIDTRDQIFRLSVLIPAV